MNPYHYNPKPGSLDGPPSSDFLPIVEANQETRAQRIAKGIVGAIVLGIPLGLILTAAVWATAWLIHNFPGGS